ncbi:MAG: hypothetical protein ACLR1T_11205 [Evtepia gabavorous]
MLLLISFVMQQRNHLALQDLNDSISNTQGDCRPPAGKPTPPV